MASKIAFYEAERTEQERKDFVQFVKSKIVKYVHLNPDTELVNFDVLFIHQPDFADLKQDDGNGNQLMKPCYVSSWIILFGGNPSEFSTNTDGSKVIQYINYADLKDRFEEVIKNILDLKEITRIKLEQIIFSIDPELEKRLEQFGSFHPLATPTPELKIAKTTLQTYVNTKLGK